MERKKISYPDFAWLRMDDPNNLMVITGLMTFDTPLDYERLKSTVEHRLLLFRRFRQRLVPSALPFMRPYWEEDPNFNLESHLQLVQLPFPVDQQVLQDLVSVLMSVKLDYSRPLWQFYLIEKYGKGSAIIARLHHSIADGISLVQVLLSMTSTDPNDSPAGPQQDRKPASYTPIGTNQSSTLSSGKWNVNDLRKEASKLLTDPTHTHHRLHQVANLAASVGKLVLRWPDPMTLYKGPLGKEKSAAWSEPIALDEVKYIGKTFSGTVNDVLLTAVAGALGRYLAFRGEMTEEVNIRSFVPVNLRPIELDDELGNKFGLVFLSLPMGIPDPVERLRRIKHNMDEIKSSSEAVATFGIINLLGAVPPRLEEIAVDFFDTKGTTIITNVPGPQFQLYLAGAPINTAMAWVPQSGRISLGVSIVSYNGKVFLGVASDKKLVPQPAAIVEFFYAEFKEMFARAKKVERQRKKLLQPAFSNLDQAIQTLDELLATDARTET